MDRTPLGAWPWSPGSTRRWPSTAQTFSACNSATGPFPGLPVAPDGDDADDLIARHRDQMPLYGYMATWDPPEHHAYRSLLTGLFTPRRLRDNEDSMWRLADQELDKFLARGAGKFITGYAQPFTLLVIADLLGVPEADLGLFRDWFRTSRGLSTLDDDALTTRDRDSEESNLLGFFESIFTRYITYPRRPAGYGFRRGGRSG